MRSLSSNLTIRRSSAAAGIAIMTGLTFAAVPAQAAPSAACPIGASTCSATFQLTGAPQTFVVPAGVHMLTATIAAGSGGTGHQVVQVVTPPPRRGMGATTSTKTTPTAGGAGGKVTVHIPVTPGEQLTVVVGGKGSDADSVAPNVSRRSISIPGATLQPGGYGGGGAALDIGGSDGAGGGGSFLFNGATIVAAAGGGGGGGYTDGGAGGAGGAGANGASATPSNYGGGGATTTAPGAGGIGANETDTPGRPGTGPASGPSTFGVGGGATADDLNSESSVCFGGSGGGGVYGGGSGACTFGGTGSFIYGSGGGGSGALGEGVTAVSRSTNTGNGFITLSWPKKSTKTTLTATPSTVNVGGTITLTATVTGTGATSGRVAYRAAVSGLTGSVTFRQGSKVLGSAALHNGIATINTKAGAAGKATFTATYGGSTAYASSTSRAAAVTVQAAAVGPSVNTGGTVSAPTSTETGFIAGGLGGLALLFGGTGLVLVRGRRD